MEVEELSHMVFTAQLSEDNQSEHAAFLHGSQERKTDVVSFARTS